MAWFISAVPVGEGPDEFWVDDDGLLSLRPVAGAEELPGRFVLPGLVDAHAHPSIAVGAVGPEALGPSGIAEVLRRWASEGVTHVRDTGSPGGVTLDVDPEPGLPRLQAAGRFLAPPGRYFPALLPEGAPEDQLTELALAELRRGAAWVKVVADFPGLVNGLPASPPEPSYSRRALETMIEAVHRAGGRVAAHVTTDMVDDLVRAGIDSVEHGTAVDEATLRAMATTGAAWTPTVTALVELADGDVPEETRARLAATSERLRTLLPMAVRLGVPVLTGTDAAGSIVAEIRQLAAHGLEPAEALAAASSTALAFLGETAGRASLVTYPADPREDLDVLENPAAVVIDGVRVR